MVALRHGTTPHFDTSLSPRFISILTSCWNPLPHLRPSSSSLCQSLSPSSSSIKNATPSKPRIQPKFILESNPLASDQLSLQSSSDLTSPIPFGQVASDPYVLSNQIWIRKRDLNIIFPQVFAVKCRSPASDLESLRSFRLQQLLSRQQRDHFFALVIGMKYELLASNSIPLETTNLLQAQSLYEQSLRESIPPNEWRTWLLSVVNNLPINQ